ncbi:MAG: geranylgeranylglycerol-phosphate geranylgeranyltransferase [Candidatus Bathyarchaeia archaeon]
MGMDRIRGSLRLIRPVNSAMMGLAVAIGVFMASKGAAPWTSYILGFSVGFLLTAGTMCINDYYDRGIDAVNAPGRPIPSGQVTPGYSLGLGVLLAASGLAVSALINIPALMIAAASVALMAYYNVHGKRTGLPGNLIVSICVSLPFLFGGAVSNRISGVLTVFSLMAFLANTGREVAKGIADVEGDRGGGVKTLAVERGSRFAGRVAALFYLAAVALSPIPLAMGWLSPMYGLTVSVADLGFLHSSMRLFRGVSPRDAWSVKSQSLIWMALGLASFLIGGL